MSLKYWVVVMVILVMLPQIFNELDAHLIPGELVIATIDSSDSAFIAGADYEAMPLDQLPIDHVLEMASNWATRADTLLSFGDSELAGESLLLAIRAVSFRVIDLEPLQKVVWLDSISIWANRYIESFAEIDQIAGPGEEGLSQLDAVALEITEELNLDSINGLSESTFDSLLLIAADSIIVEIDTTIQTVDLLPDIPDTNIRQVDDMIRYFVENERGRKAMEVWLERAATMVPRMQPVLKSQGVPEDLIYLSMVESGFRTDARSWARAVGPWQFIYSTGKIFGLESDWWFDERRDPEKSAHAAASYLRQLYEHLGDWYLALGAYNCGEGRMGREIRRSNSRVFWNLKKLPKQTRNYVPTFLAARRIAKNPEAYGFKSVDYIDPLPRDSVIVPECVDIPALAEAIGSNVETLKNMNPALIRWCTPPTRDSTVVYVPQGLHQDFETKFASIPAEKKTSWTRHKVKKGETLSSIANDYKTTMRAIMDVPANRLRNPNRIKQGQEILIPIAPHGVEMKYSSLYDFSEPDLPGGTSRKTYRVRKGDTLSEIAERNQVGLSKLLNWNGLSQRSIIVPGQTLVLYEKSSSYRTDAKSPNIKPALDKQGRYKVTNGDSFWSISNKYGISMDELVTVNGMTKSSMLHPGQMLTIPQIMSPENASITYTVRSGDTLSDIASVYNVTVSDLCRWNNINDKHSLKIGDEIVIIR